MMSSKSRKISGRAGVESTAAANYAFGALEDEIIIKHRLLTRATTTRGEPPFKKLQKKFTSLYSEIENDTNNNNDDGGDGETTTTSAAARLARAFLQELSTFEIPLLKARASIEANLREKEHFVDLNNEIGDLISRAKEDIESLKLLLEESRVERRHKEECESVRRLVAAQPPRARTQRAIEELEAEIAALDAEDDAGVRTFELRKKQFALLLHVVDELQSAVEDDGRSLPEAAVVQESGGKNGGAAAGGGGEDAMVVD